jgi:hypothetical protein
VGKTPNQEFAGTTASIDRINYFLGDGLHLVPLLVIYIMRIHLGHTVDMATEWSNAGAMTMQTNGFPGQNNLFK